MEISNEATKGFYRLEVVAEFASVFLDKQIANYVISDGLDVDSTFEVMESVDNGQSGAFQSSLYNDGVLINIYGTWQWLLDEFVPNTAVFSSTLDRIEVPASNFNGTPTQFSDQFNDVIVDQVNAEIKYTGFGVGTITESESLTDGSEVQENLVPFDMNEY